MQEKGLWGNAVETPTEGGPSGPPLFLSPSDYVTVELTNSGFEISILSPDYTLQWDVAGVIMVAGPALRRQKGKSFDQPDARRRRLYHLVDGTRGSRLVRAGEFV